MNNASWMQRPVRDAMQTKLHAVEPDMMLPEVEREFVRAGVSGFPVVERDQLVGVITRSDIVRQLCVEQSLSEMVSDYYLDIDHFDQDPREELDAIGDRLGRRIEQLQVRDVMRSKLLNVAPDAPLAAVVDLLLTNRIHRVLVTEQNRLVGLVTALDLIRLVSTD